MTLTAWPPEYSIRISKKAKNVRLGASIRRGLEIVVPVRFNHQHIPKILEENKNWIAKKLAELQIHSAKSAAQSLPTTLPLLGMEQVWPVTYIKTDNQKIKIMTRPQQEIVLLGDVDNKKICYQALVGWIKSQAKKFLPQQLTVLSELMHLPYKQITIRDQESRWGSCSSAGTISLNYKLIFLPPQLMRHILIHELCHLMHMNHSSKFWRLVAKYDLDWKQHNHETKRADKFVPMWLQVGA